MDDGNARRVRRVVKERKREHRVDAVERRHKQHRSDDVEIQMDERGTLGVLARADAGKQRRDAGAVF